MLVGAFFEKNFARRWVALKSGGNVYDISENREIRDIGPADISDERDTCRHAAPDLQLVGHSGHVRDYGNRSLHCTLGVIIRPKRRMTVLAPVTARKKAIGWAEGFRTTDGGTNAVRIRPIRFDQELATSHLPC